MYPLQLEDANTLILTLVGVIFAAGLIAVLFFAFRKTGAMSNQLSKEAEARLKAIRPPTSQIGLEEPARGISHSTPAKSSELPHTGSDHVMAAELRDNKRQLDQLARTMAAIKENVGLMRSETEGIKAKIHALDARITANSQEAQKLKITIEQLNNKIDNQRREMARQTEEFTTALEKTRMERYAEPQIPAATTREPAHEPTLTSAQQPTREVRTSRLFGNIFNRQMRTCANCGRQLESKDRYCDSCGKPTAQL